MKHKIIALALLSISHLACASTLSDSTAAHVEHYTYGSHPDIAKVISLDQVPAACAVVPVHMTYEDSQGKRHVMEYEVMGDGCNNG